MFVAFFVVLIVGAAAELYVALQVAHQIGALETVFVLVGLGLFGAWVIRRVGKGAIARTFASLAEGRSPTDDMINGGLGFAAGLLLFIPGFISAAFGVLLLLPPIRALLRSTIRARVKRRIAAGRASRFGPRFGTVINTEGGATRRPSRQSELE